MYETAQCEYTHKNVCLYQNTTFLLSTQMLHPYLCLEPRRETPHQGDMVSTVGQPSPHPQSVPKALSSLTGGVADALLPAGVDRRD